MKLIKILVVIFGSVTLLACFVFISTIVGAIGYGIVFPPKSLTNTEYKVETVNLQVESPSKPNLNYDLNHKENDAPTGLESNTNTSVDEINVTNATSSETAGQKNALQAAKNYLSVLPFSYSGLIKQLAYDKYSNTDATYAADNCNADWKEQALKSAQNYLLVLPFSYRGLVTQLKYDGYTDDQASYGADNCNADWNSQAVKSAKNYLELMSFSRDSLIDQLKFDGFTNEHASHGATQNGY